MLRWAGEIELGGGSLRYALGLSPGLRLYAMTRHAMVYDSSYDVCDGGPPSDRGASAGSSARCRSARGHGGQLNRAASASICAGVSAAGIAIESLVPSMRAVTIGAVHTVPSRTSASLRPTFSPVTS